MNISCIRYIDSGSVRHHRSQCLYTRGRNNCIFSVEWYKCSGVAGNGEVKCDTSGGLATEKCQVAKPPWKIIGKQKLFYAWKKKILCCANKISHRRIFVFKKKKDKCQDKNP